MPFLQEYTDILEIYFANFNQTCTKFPWIKGIQIFLNIFQEMITKEWNYIDKT